MQSPRGSRYSLLGAVVSLVIFSACPGGGAADAGVDAGLLSTVPEFRPRGTLNGTVVDAYDSAPLPGAKVTISYDGTANTVTTGPDGAFSFPNIPASANPGGAHTATGRYSVSLDMTGVTIAGRKYKPYRTTQVQVQFTDITDNTPLPAADTVPHSTAVTNLVSNVTFSAHQARGTIKGLVKTSDQQPLATGLILVAGAGSSLPAGASAAVVTSGADGSFTFTEIEEGVFYTVAPTDQNFILDTGGNNYNGGSIYAADQGAVVTMRTVILIPRPSSDTQAPYVSTADPAEAQVLGMNDVSKNIVLTFNEKMNITHPDAAGAVASFIRLGERGKPNSGVQPPVAFTASWDMTGTILTIDPTANLQVGYRYSLTVNNANLVDLANNRRTGAIPNVSPAQFDALRAVGNDDELLFEVSAESSLLVVTNLTQEGKTADNRVAGTTREEILEGLPNATSRSFLDKVDLNYYSAPTNSNCIYVYWTPPTTQVNGYNIWVRATDSSTPILVTNPTNPYNITAAKTLPLAFTQTAFNLCLPDVHQVFTSDPNGIPGIGLANQIWNNSLNVWVGVSVINNDGIDGVQTWVKTQDNTSPAFTTSGFGLSNSFYVANDAITLADNPGCSGAAARVMCPKVPMPELNNVLTTTFGQRALMVDLTESIDLASATAANVSIVSGTVTTTLGTRDPNTNGVDTESDSTVANVIPYNVTNGRTSKLAVVVNNVFGIDTGDKLVLGNGTVGIKDLIGNTANDTRFVQGLFIDNMAPMLKTVDVDAANDRVTMTFTKWVQVTAPNPAIPGSNFDPSLLSWQNLDAKAAVVTTTHSLNAAKEATVTQQFNDVGFMRGYNSTDPACVNNGNGTQVQLTGIKNPDVINSSGASSPTNSSDRGTQAYVNMLPDTTNALTQANSPGAYQSTSGVGTRSSFADTVGPRLSNVFDDRNLATGLNQFGVVTATNGNFSFRVYTTEFSQDMGTPTSAASGANPANWAVTAIDLGADNTWTGNTSADPAASAATVTVTGVVAVTVGGAGCSHSAAYDLTVNINNTGATRTFGFSSVTMAAAVLDMAGNAASSHRTWSYNPTRVSPTTSLVVPGWDRN